MCRFANGGLSMQNASNDACQTSTSDVVEAKPVWSTPQVEVLNIDRTANSGFAVTDTSVSTGPVS